jgi:hypothetical protein
MTPTYRNKRWPPARYFAMLRNTTPRGENVRNLSFDEKNFQLPNVFVDQEVNHVAYRSNVI